MSRKIESESVDGGVRNEMEEFGEYHQECIQLTNLVKEARLSVEKAKKFAVQLTEDLELCSDETTQLQQCIEEVASSLAEAVTSTLQSQLTLENFKNASKVKIELIIKEDIEELEPSEDTEAVFVAQLEHSEPHEEDDSNGEAETPIELNESFEEG